MAANKTFQVAARVTEEEKNSLIKFCEENDIPMSQVIRRAIKEFLEKQGVK